ncbi:MAG TPA: helix-hairpin-helix domain-containing protein [Syntrophales bacterium]|jgi:competence protein ComEA|nr:helix-hairpin-helix domain-containing protein [Syntrophales bacterium]
MCIPRMLRRWCEIPFTDGQRDGTTALFLIAVAVILVFHFTPPAQGLRTASDTDERSGPIAVVLEGGSMVDGVYFLKPGTTHRTLGERIGVPAEAWRCGSCPDRVLATGTFVLWKGPGSGETPRFGPLDAARRLALGLPIDINRSKDWELAMAPGIGPKMAEKIVRFREKRGRIRRLEELTGIRGIKKKRLEALRPYLAVLPDGCWSCEDGFLPDRKGSR